MKDLALRSFTPHGIGRELVEPDEPCVALRSSRECYEDVGAQLVKSVVIVHFHIIARHCRTVTAANRVRSQKY